MDLLIHKSNQSKGLYCHKTPHGLNITQTKGIASKDISESEEINYIAIEYKILEYIRHLNELRV